jgi:hypothetical protein
MDTKQADMSGRLSSSSAWEQFLFGNQGAKGTAGVAGVGFEPSPSPLKHQRSSVTVTL